jgi:hypothetical protein
MFSVIARSVGVEVIQLFFIFRIAPWHLNPDGAERRSEFSQ